MYLFLLFISSSALSLPQGMARGAFQLKAPAAATKLLNTLVKRVFSVKGVVPTTGYVIKEEVMTSYAITGALNSK